jgi:hypothetical protein
LGELFTSKFSIAKLVVAFMILLSGLLTADTGNFPHGYSTSLPPYASVGAYANYTGAGGNIAFLSGVSGNISYYVSRILSNGSMDLTVLGNLSLGTELGIPTTNVSLSLTDQIYSPKYFPAIPPEDLVSRQIDFQNISCSYKTGGRISVPAGTFNGVEYQGIGANGSVLDFWFDNATGLALQMSGSAAELQLATSNIAQPLVVQSPSNVELPIIAVFLVGWALAGLLFYVVRRHYLRKSQSEGLLTPAKGSGQKSKKQKGKNSRL